MSVQVYADDVLIYDPALDDTALIALSVTASTDKAGTATLTMPPGHPAYHAFTSYKTQVMVYRGAELLFRGRALYVEDDFYNRRTVTCEGERGYLHDSTRRPYLYQDAPSAIFSDLITLHNAQVDAFKTFQVGTVDVTDPNNYIRLESESAEQTSDVIDKLVERVGGYIVFTTNASGQRVINWLEAPNYKSNQAIEFGSNLIDFTRSGSDTDLATVIIPYGAKDEETGERVTIESVNDGLDFIQDLDAVALRGVVSRPVYWDDVTEPANLLAKAQKYLATSKLAISSIELTAVDLSALDASIDTFEVGDKVRVRSEPHEVDEDFLLVSRTYDLLNPANDRVTLGKDIASLTGADVAGDRDVRSELHDVQRSIKSDYTLGIAQAVESTQLTLSTLIQQTSEAIRLEVSETYATNDMMESHISTAMTQLADSFNFEFTKLQEVMDANDADARQQFEEIHKYIRFVDGNILLGESGNELVLRIENDRISFLDGGAEVAYFSNKQLHVLDGYFFQSLRVGPIAFIPRENGNTSLVKVG